MAARSGGDGGVPHPSGRRAAGRDPISYLFLGPDTVWKLKKAVRLPFLDFTRLEDRHHFCERELALNAPAAPGLYRDVVPIVRQPMASLLGRRSWRGARLGRPHGPRAGERFPGRRGPRRAVCRRHCSTRSPTPSPPGICRCRRSLGLRPDMAAIAEGNVRSAHRRRPAGGRGARLARRHAGGPAIPRRLARCPGRGRFRPPLSRRSASGQSVPLARPAGPVRRAGIRRGAGDHRCRLRSGVSADGPGAQPGPGRRQSRAEPLRGADRRRRPGRAACRSSCRCAPWFAPMWRPARVTPTVSAAI